MLHNIWFNCDNKPWIVQSEVAQTCPEPVLSQTKAHLTWTHGDTLKRRKGAEHIKLFYENRFIKDFKNTEKRVLPLEEWMCSAQHTVDDVEISTSEASHHLC